MPCAPSTTSAGIAAAACCVHPRCPILPCPKPRTPAAQPRCVPYHAWTYNLDGSLRAAPYVRFDAGCPKDQFSLVPVQLDTWGGFVFVNLAEKPATPLREQLDGPVRRLVRYPLVDLRRGAQIVYDVKANWKIIMENYNECYHCGPVHPELCALVPLEQVRNTGKKRHAEVSTQLILSFSLPDGG